MPFLFAIFHFFLQELLACRRSKGEIFSEFGAKKSYCPDFHSSNFAKKINLKIEFEFYNFEI